MQVTPKILHRAAREVFGVSGGGRMWRRLAWPATLLLALGAAGVAAGHVSIVSWPLLWPGAPQPAARGAAAPAPAAVVATAPAVHVPAAAARADGGRAEDPLLERLHWPDGSVPRARSEEFAFHDLMKLYGAALEPAPRAVACRVAETANMRCVDGRGALSRLRELNRPAVLRIDGGHAGEPFYAVLAALDTRSATFIVAGQRQRVDLANVAPLWSGHYALLTASARAAGRTRGVTATVQAGHPGPAAVPTLAGG
jgi:hypothetical protein